MPARFEEGMSGAHRCCLLITRRDLSCSVVLGHEFLAFNLNMVDLANSCCPRALQIPVAWVPRTWIRRMITKVALYILIYQLQYPQCTISLQVKLTLSPVV